MEWIACEDRYPDTEIGTHEEFLVVNMNDPIEPYPFVCGYTGEKERGFELLRVTHWCEIPRLPE